MPKSESGYAGFSKSHGYAYTKPVQIGEEATPWYERDESAEDRQQIEELEKGTASGRLVWFVTGCIHETSR